MFEWDVRMDDVLRAVEHRPWPLPSAPWIMSQVWHDLLFAHWQVPPEELRPLVPEVLPLQTFNGQCWVAVTPFHMSHVLPRGMPSIGGHPKFPELNVRTYVTFDGKPGVYFFSLDAASLGAVLAARAWFRLPYFYSRMRVTAGEQRIEYHCERRVSPQAEFHGNYGPVTPPQLRSPGTLEHWLTERYCLYTVVRRSIFRAEIHHLQWPLQDATAEIAVNTMAAAAGICLPQVRPLLHFARELQVYVWPLRRIA